MKGLWKAAIIKKRSLCFSSDKIMLPGKSHLTERNTTHIAEIATATRSLFRSSENVYKRVIANIFLF